MRRVAVTGLGAVTPLGNDAQSTWKAAVAGESGIDWIRSFDPGDAPVRIAAEVKDFDAAQVASLKEVRKLERNVLLALGAGREAVQDAGLNGFDPTRVGIVFGTAIGGVNGILEQDVPLKLAHLLRGGDLGRIEVLHLGGDPYRQAVHVERADPVDPAPAGDRRLPSRGGVVPDRRDGAEAGDCDALHPGKVTNREIWANKSTIPS